jgi:ornithine--oxo-acid transaminase
MAITDHIATEDRFGAHNYHPLPVVLSHGEGVWVHDTGGRRYFDALSAYSALNFGHRHPRLVAAAVEQLGRLTLTSRAFHNDQLGPFCAELAEFCEHDRVLPMNTGAEAVETALKLARRWGYDHKGVPPDRAEIVVCAGNFHGRTTTIVGFSDDPLARTGFGPFGPGFVTVPFGDATALRAAIGPCTVGFLVEPIQGECGVMIPPDGYLSEVRSICTETGVLMIADEIQSGLGRAGRRFACDHEDVRPDLYVLGKALGGGILPLSAVVGRDDVVGVLRPGEHGSTFGGNPLACGRARGAALVGGVGPGGDVRAARGFSSRASACGRPRLGRGRPPARHVAGDRPRQPGARGDRATDGARRAGQGRARDDAAHRPAADDDTRGARLRPRRAGRRARRQRRRRGIGRRPRRQPQRPPLTSL